MDAKKQEELVGRVAEAATEKERPDGSRYLSLSFAEQRRLAHSHGSDHKAVQLVALRQGIVPEVYARNQKRLSSEDQIKLLRSHVVVIGLGGLGGTVTEILARIGIGRLTLVDGDRFDDSNLNRQLLSSTEVLGKPKSAVAETRVQAVNPAVETRAVTSFLTAENAENLMNGATIAVDCLDSITGRFTLEAACRKMGIVMVSAAIGGTSGQLTVIYPEDQGLSRVYGPPEKAVQRGVEKTMGTLPFAAITMAAMECAEVVAMAAGEPSALRNRLLFTDLIDHTLEIVDLE
ncbi:MAG: ThiF family adenylyltransferase [Desulfofustis sp.]|jgi:molybdopterin/thiamine biosynthesis adenylyltransferase